MAVLKRLALLALLLAAPASGAPPAAPEYDVKAVFLYNFTKFVDWPAAAFAEPGSSLRLCVVGEDPFGKALSEVAVGEVAGHPLTLLRLNGQSNLAACHVLFVSRSEREHVPQILAAVREAPVLTVADTPGFLDRGGMINFVLEGTKVRFEIDQAAAEKAGLQISSKLLRLARPRTAGS